ncbi:LysR family transcriptional regulator [Delftia sp. PS-11]|uniref:LysR family transcriptional regulator n=1 Tax=Delftia sp. PS-11 TaxID=2767222 RepID=UPI0024549A45|nr:LysR family transcriptional regulator [Delftia sp. PS-11]KAJ8741634.1 LysR family transcriptional regulator [Delftia sp. PS-11]
MNTRFIEAFLWSARLGSFRAAGERLNITQAAVAHRIASLEDDIGAKLFVRDPRELRLTAVGTRLLGYGERLLEIRQDIIALGRTDVQMLGVVRIGVIETVVHTWLVSFLENLRATYPGIEVQLTSETTRGLHRALHERALDIAVQTEQIDGPGIRSTACLPMPMGWVGAADAQAEQSLRELLTQPVLTMSPGSQPHEAVKQMFRDAGLPIGKVHCVSSISALVKLVSAGFGHAVMPLPPVLEYAQRGDIRFIRCEAQVPPQRLVVSHVEQVPASPDAIRVVAELACMASDRYTSSISVIPPMAPAHRTI